eukprot:277995_1
MGATESKQFLNTIWYFTNQSFSGEQLRKSVEPACSTIREKLAHFRNLLDRKTFENILEKLFDFFCENIHKSIVPSSMLVASHEQVQRTNNILLNLSKCFEEFTVGHRFLSKRDAFIMLEKALETLSLTTGDLVTVCLFNEEENAKIRACGDFTKVHLEHILEWRRQRLGDRLAKTYFLKYDRPTNMGVLARRIRWM